MRRAVGTGGLIALAAAAGAAGAVGPGGPEGAAAGQGPRVEVRDEADTAGKLDVVRAVVEPAARGRLRVEVTMREPWATADLRTTDGSPPASVCLKAWTRRRPGDGPPDYLACATPARAGESLRGSVLRERLNGLPRRVGAATVTRPNGSAVALRFAQSKVGSPRRLRLAVETVTWPDCPRPRGCVDAAPDPPATARLSLPAPRGR